MRYPPLIPAVPHMLHGSDYNPEQWLPWKEEIWTEDMRLMKLAGLNVVSVGIFAWAALEPQEGVYTFEWLDEMLDLLHANGITAILATPSGARPAWMAQAYPEVLRVRPDGQRNLFSGRHNHCWSSPVYREKVRALNTKLAERYQNHPALGMWHISNEYSGECFCQRCQQGFREYLKRRHGTLENLNRAYWSAFWSHTYFEWNQIEAPSTFGESMVNALNLDWRRYVTEQVVDFYQMETAPLKQITPRISCTTNLMSTHEGIDYFRLGEVLDVVSWDNYPLWSDTGRDLDIASQAAFNHDLMRGCGRQKPWMLMESSPSATNWQPVSKLRRPGVHRLASLQAIAHGSDTVQYFQFRKSRGSSEKYHGAVVGHSGHENTRVFREVQQVSEALGKMDAICGTRAGDGRVALIYDWPTRWALTGTQGMHNTETQVGGMPSKDKGYLGTVLMHYRALWSRGVGVDIVDSSMPLDGYRLVLAPMLYLLRPGCAERLEAFVKGGGTLVTTYMTGYADENDLSFLGGFPGPLRGVMGYWAEELDALYPEETVAVQMGSRTYAAQGLCEVIHPEDGAEVLATYGSEFYQGSPALLRHAYGKGRAYHMAARMEQAFLNDFYETLCAEAGVRPALPTGLPEGVSATIRSDGDTEFVFLMNYTPAAQRVDVGPGGPELLTGGTLSGQTELPAYGVRVFSRRAENQ